jgi:hypothetical protein
MGHEAIKLELIEWLEKLNDADTLNFLKLVKDSRKANQDWWAELTNNQKMGIERGLRDIEPGKTTPHSEIAKRYGI